MMKPYTYTHGRNTGRTHKMVIDAVKASLSGEPVCILCPSIGCASDVIRKKVAVLLAERGLTILKDFLFKTVDSCDIEGRIDWKNKQLIGIQSHFKLFIDHHVWVEQFGFAIDAFHEYD